MIQVEKLSYGFPAKDLYHNISFSLETGRHCALIGSNGTGKSTLTDMLMQPEEYLFDGKIIRDDSCRIGYASQFSAKDKLRECTVFAYLSERFLKLQKDIASACDQLAEAEDMEAALEKYQNLLDLNEAMDGDHYENNIRKKLYAAGMTALTDIRLPKISGGEYKLLQIMKEMLLSPNLLILDEPDVFLDFANLNSLCRLINDYKGTLLVVTHSRYLLNHCFNKILHLENCELQEFDGNYTEYRCFLLREKLRMKLQSVEEQEEIQRTEQMVQVLRKRATDMVNPVIGKSVNAKQSQLDRLRARQIKAPFIEALGPEIVLPKVESAGTSDSNPGSGEKPVLSISDYCVEFDEDLLQDVSFEIQRGEKAAIVGANGTGKTTLIRDILRNDNPSVSIDEHTAYACLSQLSGETADETETVYEALQKQGIDSREAASAYLAKFRLEEELLDRKICLLSGGEQNLLQIALMANSDAEFLILDEPTSHLDLYGQMALEKAISQYKGTVLMVSHDFYLVAGCADYVFLVEDNRVRRMRVKNFRKMVYDKYFDRKYLETDRKKQELEAEITEAFQNEAYALVDKLCIQLEALSGRIV